MFFSKQLQMILILLFGAKAYEAVC